MVPPQTRLRLTPIPPPAAAAAATATVTLSVSTTCLAIASQAENMLPEDPGPRVVGAKLINHERPENVEVEKV